MPEKKHSRVRFDFSDNTSIWYTDTRNFGTLKFNMTLDETNKKCLSLGPDPLTHDIPIDVFRKNLYTKNMPNPDILIRTGGKNRLSNFMLWQLA